MLARILAVSEEKMSGRLCAWGVGASIVNLGLTFVEMGGGSRLGGDFVWTGQVSVPMGMAESR